MQYRQPFRGDYPITQRYGETYTSSFHTGIDYACPEGTPILASADGTVMMCGWDSTGYGFRVILKHGDGRATLYAHLSKVLVNLYDRVLQGEEIGLSGNTGNSTGPHLHFEARNNWNQYASHFDPMTLPLMNFADVPTGSSEGTSQNFAGTSQELHKLKGADKLGEAVEIVAPLGAWAWSHDFSRRQTVYPQGTKLHFTGQTSERNGYTYCEVYPEPVKFWVAVHDHDCQILDNQG